LRKFWNYRENRRRAIPAGQFEQREEHRSLALLFNDKMKPEEHSRLAVGWTTTATLEDAHRLAALVVERRLVACAQVSGPLTSVYQWNGQLQRDEEYRLTLKFPALNADALSDVFKEHHPYQVPQWLWVIMDGCGREYEAWAIGQLDGSSAVETAE
jgi:periplasmic divalent cation tolerance protein